ncbi:MAG: hypothetical protein PF440_02575 [Thiomicrorhabdus sp.]|jgi:hypothetical protein|nr:hypothetical protein [Thiomicrorhabdus sp.]
MDIKALFESGVLTQETKVIIEEAFDVAVKAKETELAEAHEVGLVEAKVELTTSMMEMVEEAVAEEIEAIAEEIEHARTLEIQYAEKLEIFKESFAEKQDEQMRILVAESVAEEISEISEDIEMAKKHEFTMQMFESFKDVYGKLFGGVEVDIIDELAEAKKELDGFKRQIVLDEILESVAGTKRQVALTILESVETDKLEKKFESIKSALLAETTEATDKEAITESNKEKDITGTIVMENEEAIEESTDEASTATNPLALRLQRSIKNAQR